MKTRTGTVFVTILTILAILGGIGGFIGTSGYLSFLGISEGFRAGCQVLRIGEAMQVITKSQRAEIAKLSMPNSQGDEQFTKYFLSDCSKSAVEWSYAEAKR
jgi:hypothetical protein